MQTTPEDNLTKSKTIYDASSGEIVWKNFLAGFSRTLGGIIVYFVFVAILGSLFLRFAMPIMSPFLGQLSTITNTLQRIPGR